MSHRLRRVSVMLCVVVQWCLLADAQAKPAFQSGMYRNWLNEDVLWIVTDEERAAFNKLASDEERDQFIEQFWRRRDPTPDTLYNELKVEHYRRIVAANERFQGEVPGWKTDRGRIYILHGRPGRVESAYFERDSVTSGLYHPVSTEPSKQAVSDASKYPAEIWTYRCLENIGEDVRIYFVDSCRCGEYVAAYSVDKDVSTAAAGLTSLTKPPPPLFDSCGNRFQPTELLQAFICGQKGPSTRFKDLEEFVVHGIKVHFLPFAVWTDSVEATCCADLVTVFIELRNKDISLSLINKGVQHGKVNIYGRLATLTGRIAEVFEDSVNFSAAEDKVPTTVRSITLALRPGLYRLDLAVQDAVGDRVGTLSRELLVPEFEAPSRP